MVQKQKYEYIHMRHEYEVCVNYIHIEVLNIVLKSKVTLYIIDSWIYA